MEECSFEECIQKARNAKKMTELFQVWKSAQCCENRELKEFNEDFYKSRRERNTISSHFLQFVNKENCKGCRRNTLEFNKLEEDFCIWKKVLDNAFNADGEIGKVNVRAEGYETIFLLKEANDSKKTCIMDYLEWQYNDDDESSNVWIQQWRDGKEGVKAPMLDKLSKAYSKNDNSEKAKDVFTKEAAYMNVNKRGGTAKTVGYDETALMNYAAKYREFILQEIYLLMGDNEHVKVFVGGSKNYFQRLMKNLKSDKLKILLNEGQDEADCTFKGKHIHFFQIYHPSSRISVKKLSDSIHRDKN